jgi:hypothetical protein
MTESALFSPFLLLQKRFQTSRKLVSNLATRYRKYIFCLRMGDAVGKKKKHLAKNTISA